MSNTDTPADPTRMSDEAVQAKTGRTWPEWFAILDAASAQQMTHQQIVAYLHTEQGVGPWWQQMVTVTYERSQPVKRCDPVGVHLLSSIGVGKLVVLDGDLDLSRALGVELHINST